jgi:hypothetical protein
MVYHHTRFKSFDQITSLTLDHFSVISFDPPTLERTFCDLTVTVTSLCLLHPRACSRSLLCFLSAFRNLQDTVIHAPRWKDTDHDSSLAAPSQFRGNLRLSELNDKSSSFLSLLGSQSTAYERIALIKCSFHSFRPLQQFISATGRSVRSLQIVVPDHGEYILSLFECPLLTNMAQERCRRFRPWIVRSLNKFLLALPAQQLHSTAYPPSLPQ